MTKKEKTHYECYSYLQFKYLTTMGFTPAHSNIHRKTGKRFWVFYMSAKLAVALQAYTVMRNMIDSGQLKATNQEK